MTEPSVRARRATSLSILVALFALTACGGESAAKKAEDKEPAEPETFTASGSITLTDSDVMGWGGGVCTGWDGYDDMEGGAERVIRDGDGTKVAVGALEDGHFGGMKVICVFDFTVEDVPSGGGVYSVEVGHRGEVAFTEDEASGLELSLG